MNRLTTLILISVVVATLFFILLGYSHCIFSESFIPKDTYSYIQAGDALYSQFKPHPIRTIGFAALIGMPHLILSQPTLEQYIAFGILLNLICWIGTIAILFKSLHLFIHKKPAFLLSLSVVFSFGLLASSFLLLTESLSTLMLTAIVYYLLKYEKDKRPERLVVAVAILNFLVLVRPSFFYLSMLSIGILGIFLIRNKIRWSSKYLILAISASFLLLQPFLMQRTFGEWTFTFVDRIAWYQCLGAETEAAATGKSYTEEFNVRNSRLKSFSLIGQAEIGKSDMKYQLKNNLGIMLKQYISNLVSNSYGASYSISALRDCNTSKGGIYSSTVTALFHITRGQNILYILLFIFSIGLLLKNPSSLSSYLIAGIIGYAILISGIALGQGDRFHLVLYPSILTLFSRLANNKSFARPLFERNTIKQHHRK